MRLCQNEEENPIKVAFWFHWCFGVPIVGESCSFPQFLQRHSQTSGNSEKEDYAYRYQQNNKHGSVC
jgi:hypothetical protein